MNKPQSHKQNTMAPHSILDLHPIDWDINDDASCPMDTQCSQDSSLPIKQTTSRVRFSNQALVATIPRRCDLTDDEINARWLNQSDYAEALVEIELTEAVMTCEINKHLVDDELLCSRGLTDSESLVARAESSTFVQQLVLNQIAFQVTNGISDFGMVAKVYHDCSVPAVEKAQMIALRDADDAKRYLSP